MCPRPSAPIGATPISPYGADPQHRLDVYVPERAAAAPRPLVVFWHGGRWSFGDKADYRFVGAALADLGYVAVLANYRHYPRSQNAGLHGRRRARRALGGRRTPASSARMRSACT